ncbi:MAG: lipocalin-like domain-containing protein [Xanthobacteraceae bacterium]
MKRTTVGACALAFAALVALGGEATAQQKTLKERLAGTWHFVIAEVTAPDGKKSFPFGPTPRGMVIFTPGGDFMQIHIASEVPKIANGNRLNATPEEYAGIMRGTIAQFGTYTVTRRRIP